MNEDDTAFTQGKAGPRLRRRWLCMAAALAMALIASRSAYAQATREEGAAAKSAGEGSAPAGSAPALTMEEALSIALSGDPGLRSAELDRRSAEAEAEAASRKGLPSLAASLGYARLSELPAPDDSLPNEYSFELDLSYPIYDGGRREQSLAMAKLQAGLKGAEGEESRRSLAFELRKGYWEACRAANAASAFEEDLRLAQAGLELVEGQFARGSASEADLLAARTRSEKSADDLDEARTEMESSFMRLASIMGVEPSSLPAELATKPSAEAAPAWPESLDAASLVSEALERRPESREALIGIEIAKRQAELARAALRPTLTASGSYAYADPSARLQSQTDPSKFTGTWSLGATLSFDLGGLPAGLSGCRARDFSSERASADAEARRRAVALDVGTCVLKLRRSRRALASAETAARRAEDGLRIAEGRLAAGTIRTLELESVRAELRKAKLDAADRLIDDLIASEDLARAVALDERCLDGRSPDRRSPDKRAHQGRE